MTKSFGWYGGGEKAETFYFEHDWKPVPGHPEEVATCGICGLNRWSDQHMSASERSMHLRRTKELRLNTAPPLPEEALNRLSRNYGPTPPAPPTGPAASGPSPREVETEAIADNAKTAAAEAVHPFMAAEFPDDQGEPRCRLCGKDEPSHAAYLPKIPVSAAEVIERPHAPVLKEGESLAPVSETQQAFLTEVNGKTLLTAPANVFTREIEKARDANKHFLWMQGRFVGAENANRNGAFWSTADLELGQPSVENGPLNWLHESRHIIGTLAKAQLVTRNEAAAEDLQQPYIHAASPIWRWVYPDEAWVVEQASDAGKLWYSMECISERVACVGEGSCGAEVAYADYVANANGTCEHMTQRSAHRRFADPTFLGGAVIVPPVRPGWAEADAQVMHQAASLAEQAFAQAGEPDVPASEWEQLMAQLVRFSTA